MNDAHRTQGKNGEVLPIHTPYNRDEIRRRIESGAPPATAEEYLLRVRFEAEQMSDVVRGPKKMKNELSALDVPVWHETEKCESLIPHGMWVKDLLKRFSEIRETFSKLRNDDNECGKGLPQYDDEDAWFMFCFEGEGHPPLLSTVLKMDTMTQERVLSYHIDWLNKETTLSAHRAVWIYALLVGIDKPLSPNVASDIRRLLVMCCSMRSRLEGEEEEENLACLNIMISLAGTYYEQEEPDRRLIF